MLLADGRVAVGGADREPTHRLFGGRARIGHLDVVADVRLVVRAVEGDGIMAAFAGAADVVAAAVVVAS